MPSRPSDGRQCRIAPFPARTRTTPTVLVELLGDRFRLAPSRPEDRQTLYETLLGPEAGY